MSQDYQLIDVKRPVDWEDYHDIRRKVLFEARGNFSYDAHHPDEFNPRNQPLLLKLNEVAIGTVRLDQLYEDIAAIRLVAIRPEHQRRGHGRVLAAMVEERARAQKVTTLLVNAAREAVGYYESLGYEPYAFDPSELTGIASECVQMRKQLLSPD